MEHFNKINVYLNVANTPLLVGQMVLDHNRIYFKYDNTFLNTGLEISPFKLKTSPAILTLDTTVFDGLFGVFNDSLPDGWGRLLLDRTLTSKGISINQITPLDRLAYVGSNGMGALTYKPDASFEFRDGKLPELDTIYEEMNHVLEGTPSNIIEALYHLGGSSGGARPKIFVGYNPVTNHIIHGSDVLPDGYDHWIIKFPASTDLPDMAHIEYAYYNMALDAGIEMSECKLFEGASGKQYFGTKRFDRIGNKRVHLHSVSGLLHDNFRFSNLDYGNIMDCAFRLENHVGAYAKVLRLAAFNIYSHNRDDHSKNVSFLMDSKGHWKLAPAYDLTYSNASHGMHSTMIAGESKAPGKKHLLELAHTFSIKNPNVLIGQVVDTVSQWETYANACGVSKASYKLIDRIIKDLAKK